MLLSRNCQRTGCNYGLRGSANSALAVCLVQIALLQVQFLFFGETYTKYNETDRKTVLDPEDDAAIVNWGLDWKMPTQAQVIELKENTTSALTQVDSVNGVMLTSIANGNTLFFK